MHRREFLALVATGSLAALPGRGWAQATTYPPRGAKNVVIPWQGEPYPRDALRVVPDWSTYRFIGLGSDNWWTTWAADNYLYAAFGDGGGLGDGAKDIAYVVLGLARLKGNSAATINGVNMVGGLDPTVARCVPILPPVEADTSVRSICRGIGLNGKVRGMLALGDQLYGWWTPASAMHGYKEARVIRNRIGTNEWAITPWKLDAKLPQRLIYPVFMQAGQDHADLSDYIYVYACRYAPIQSASLNVQAGPNGGEIFLLRLPRGADPMVNTNYQYFAGLLPHGSASWSASNAAARAVIVDRNGVGPRISAAYVKQLNRYLVISSHTADYKSRFGIFSAPTPWGPWQLMFYDLFASVPITGTTGFAMNVVPNSIASDGSRLTLAFAGNKDKQTKRNMDGLNLVDASIVPAAGRVGPG